MQRYACDLCDSKFKYNKNLYAHKRTIHNCSPEQANPKKKICLVRIKSDAELSRTGKYYRQNTWDILSIYTIPYFIKWHN